MITKEEIDAKALEFGIHAANVQRDYVFGWLLHGIYSDTTLRDQLVLKGGNCFRKAYFATTRFSADLNFSCVHGVDSDAVLAEFNKACAFVSTHSGVVFDIDSNRISLQGVLDATRRVFDVRLYFRDFYGNADHIKIRLSIDITEFDRIHLPVQERRIIHPYSDADACNGTVRCLQLEEMLAAKLKCLLQRRHTADLYDLVYSIFINRDLEVDQRLVVSTFFRRTIYERSPGVARQLLLDLPLSGLRTAWNRYIVAPVQGLLDFDDALAQFVTVINALFESWPSNPRLELAFFPSHLRTPIMTAGGDMKLMRLVYDGSPRIVEPYALAYKRRKDGVAQEYFYAYDRTGGNSGPGIKAFINSKIQSLEPLEETFEPRYPVELAKAGELLGRSSFGSDFSRPRTARISRSRIRALRHGWRYTVQCNYCSRRFQRMRRSVRLNPHKDGYGNSCFGRIGTVVDQRYV